MLKDLNLLPKNTKKIRRNNQIIRYLKLSTRLIALTILIAIGAEFGWVQFTSLMVNQTKDRIKNLQTEIQSQEDLEGKYLFYQKVLTQASDQISKRKNFIEITNELFAFLPSNINIQTLSFIENLIVFQGSTNNYGSLLVAMEQLKNSPQSTYLGNISVGDISRSPDGRYTFKLEIELKTIKQSGNEK